MATANFEFPLGDKLGHFFYVFEMYFNEQTEKRSPFGRRNSWLTGGLFEFYWCLHFSHQA